MLRQKVCYFVTKNWAKFKLVHVASNCVLLCFKNWSKFRLVHVVSKGMLLCYKKLVKIQASTSLQLADCIFSPNFEEYLFVFKEALSTKETFMRGLMF